MQYALEHRRRVSCMLTREWWVVPSGPLIVRLALVTVLDIFVSEFPHCPPVRGRFHAADHAGLLRTLEGDHQAGPRICAWTSDTNRPRQTSTQNVRETCAEAVHWRRRRFRQGRAVTGRHLTTVARNCHRKFGWVSAMHISVGATMV